MEISTKNKKTWFKGDKVIWRIVLFLSLISILAVYSSSSSLAYAEGKSTMSFLFKQLSFVIFGLTALIICYLTPLKLYRNISKLALIISIILLIATALFGKNINGADRWLYIFGFSFQPSELAKITLILYLAKALEESNYETFKEYGLKIMLPIGTVLTLILIGSASVAIILGLVCFTILIIAGIKWGHLIKTIGIVAGTLGLFILLYLSFGIFPRFETAYSRVETFFEIEEVSPENMSRLELQREADKTFQADMAEIAVSTGGLLGKGPGNSIQRNILPHPYSDFIFAIIIEEYGFFGGFIVLLLYLWFFLRCVRLAKKCRKNFSAVLVVGLGLMITVQALLHIMVNVGILPVTGHTLPLVSLGGTSFIILSGGFGLILSVSRTIEKQRANNTLEGYLGINNLENSIQTKWN